MPLTIVQLRYLSRLANDMAKIISTLRALRTEAKLLNLPIEFPPDTVFLRVISEAARVKHRPEEPADGTLPS